MFEQSFVVSGRDGVPARVRWVAIASVVAQCALAALLVAIPLLHPERLVLGPVSAPTPLPTLRPVPPPRTVVERARAAAQSAAPALTVMVVQAMVAPATIPHGVERAPETIPLGPAFGQGMATGGDVLGALAATGVGIAARVGVTAPSEAGPKPRPHVSAGVSAGMLLTPITPVYPQIARAARVSGAVVVAAVISKEGRIERATVTSGPAMLRGAALAAIERARYRPYLLNGEPTEVETTITVNFQMGG